MENLEHQVNKTLAIVEQQSRDTVELQRALLDAMTLLASVVAENKTVAEKKTVADTAVAESTAPDQKTPVEQKAPAAGPVE